MIAPPRFATVQDFVARLGDVGFWRPYLVEALDRHGLDSVGRDPVAGFNATYPTFLCGNLVVKLFGRFPAWRDSHAGERAAYALIATDSEIAAPRVLGEGRLYDEGDDAWPYLIISRLFGVPARSTGLSTKQRQALAVELGCQVRRLHALPPTGVPSHEDWPGLDRTAALRASSLPPHLIAQAGEFLARLPTADRVLVHGDLGANHVYVDNGRLTGLIDWGDAMIADRHCELIQIYRDLFRCDAALFRTFLEASDWPLGADFPRLALGHALHRQTIGFTQHHTMDVFEPIAARLPLRDFATLDSLAEALFPI